MAYQQRVPHIVWIVVRMICHLCDARTYCTARFLAKILEVEGKRTINMSNKTLADDQNGEVIYMYGSGNTSTRSLPWHCMYQLCLSNFFGPNWPHIYLQQEFLAENLKSFIKSSTCKVSYSYKWSPFINIQTILILDNTFIHHVMHQFVKVTIDKRLFAFYILSIKLQLPHCGTAKY